MKPIFNLLMYLDVYCVFPGLWLVASPAVGTG